MFPEQFLFFKGYKGLVIEGTGLGQAPVGVPNDLAKLHAEILSAIKKIIESGCAVVMTSQCVFGGVQMNVYSDAIYLERAGVISADDMLTEVAFIKLAWALGNFKQDEAKQILRANLRGEINERHGIEFIDKDWR